MLCHLFFGRILPEKGVDCRKKTILKKKFNNENFKDIKPINTFQMGRFTNGIYHLSIMFKILLVSVKYVTLVSEVYLRTSVCDCVDSN